MSNFSKTWKSSVKPRKQRKYIYEAPLHIRGKFMNVHLSEELSKKLGKRSVRIRKEDKVKVVKGQFKGKTGKVERLDMKKARAYIAGVDYQKKDGTKIKYPVAVANLMIIDLDTADKKRQESMKRKQDGKKAP